MRNILYSLGLTILIIGYIIFISYIMTNGERFLGEIDEFWAPVMVLSLFVFSALVTSGLALGRPIWLYFEGKKKDALISMVSVVVWLMVLVVVVFGIGVLIF